MLEHSRPFWNFSFQLEFGCGKVEPVKLTSAKVGKVQVSVRVICKASVKEAIDQWVAFDSAIRDRDAFWLQLSEAVASPNGYAAGTLRKYCTGGTPHKAETVAAILRAAENLGVELRCEGERPKRRILDPEFLNLSLTLEKRDTDPEQPPPNRIKPDQQHLLDVKIKLDHGQKTVRFGESPSAAQIYLAKLIISQGSLQIQTVHPEICRTDNPESPFRESGDPTDLRTFSWVVEKMSSMGPNIHGPLGLWSGIFSTGDALTFSVSSDNIRLKAIEHELGGPLSKDEINAVATQEFIDAKNAQIEKVLRDAWQENSPKSYRLATVPLFPDEDE